MQDVKTESTDFIIFTYFILLWTNNFSKNYILFALLSQKKFKIYWATIAQLKTTTNRIFGDFCYLKMCTHKNRVNKYM